MGLAQDLKEGTKQSHSAAENTKFVSSFLRGVVSEDNYKKLVANFYFVYRAMEEEVFKLKDDPIIGPIRFPELNRTSALEMDLRYFYGPIWRSIVTPSEACQQYVNRIRDVAQDNPELLVGHHYTRYLGDLSGGQILKNIAEKALNLTDQGLDFYKFANITDKKEFKENYRAVLNTLPVSQSQVSAIISEANFAFRLNMFMFEELDGNAFKSTIAYICGIIKGKTDATT